MTPNTSAAATARGSRGCRWCGRERLPPTRRCASAAGAAESRGRFVSAGSSDGAGRAGRRRLLGHARQPRAVAPRRAGGSRRSCTTTPDAAGRRRRRRVAGWPSQVSLATSRPVGVGRAGHRPRCRRPSAAAGQRGERGGRASVSSIGPRSGRPSAASVGAARRRRLAARRPSWPARPRWCPRCSSWPLRCGGRGGRTPAAEVVPAASKVESRCTSPAPASVGGRRFGGRLDLRVAVGSSVAEADREGAETEHRHDRGRRRGRRARPCDGCAGRRGRPAPARASRAPATSVPAAGAASGRAGAMARSRPRPIGERPAVDAATRPDGTELPRPSARQSGVGREARSLLVVAEAVEQRAGQLVVGGREVRHGTSLRRSPGRSGSRPAARRARRGPERCGADRAGGDVEHLGDLARSRGRTGRAAPPRPRKSSGSWASASSTRRAGPPRSSRGGAARGPASTSSSTVGGRPALAAPELVEAHVGGDPVRPGAGRRRGRRSGGGRGRRRAGPPGWRPRRRGRSPSSRWAEGVGSGRSWRPSSLLEGDAGRPRAARARRRAGRLVGCVQVGSGSGLARR